MLTVGKPKAMRHAIATDCWFDGAGGGKAGVERIEKTIQRNFSGRQRLERRSRPLFITAISTHPR